MTNGERRTVALSSFVLGPSFRTRQGFSPICSGKHMATTIQIIMSVVLFLAGVVMLISGLLIIMTREYQEAMRTLSNQSTRLSGKAIGDVGVQAAVEGASQLLDSITHLIQTAM